MRKCFLSALAVLAFAASVQAQQPKAEKVDQKLDRIITMLATHMYETEVKFQTIGRRLDALEAKAPRAMAAQAQPMTGYFPQAQAGDCGSFGVRYAAAGDCGQAFASYGAGACGAASASAGDCGASAGRTGPVRRFLGRFFGN